MGDSVTVEDPELFDTFTTDGRGRVSLGTEYSGMEVKLAFALTEQDNNKDD